MLQHDLDKALDRVAHQVLFSILDVNVGNVTVDGLKMAYKNCTMCFIVNKNVNHGIDVRASVRQGVHCRPCYSLFI